MLTIGHVARRVGIQSSAIRYYEAEGVIKPAARRKNGYRVYHDDAVKLLLFVKRSQTLGITLKEIKPLLALAVQGQKPCKRVKELARHHIIAIDRQIRELQTLRRTFRAIIRRRVPRSFGNKVCPLIEGR